MNLSELTTLQIGGAIKEFKEVTSEQELIQAISQAQTQYLKCLVIGGGSNLLVSDEGFDGMVIQNKISGIEKNSETSLIVKAGTSLQDLVNFSIEEGLGGLQKLTGIPGSVGGAIYGNAGAFGQTISDHIVKIKALNDTVLLSKSECEFDYRDSGFKRNGLIILEANFQLSPASSETLKQAAHEVLEKRLKKYPPGIKCPGSFFKNLFINKLPEEVQKIIPKDRDFFGKVPAWFFLDEVGAKGDQLGQIKIADFHGNLFMNLGGGTASDFHALAQKYFDKVKTRFGIELEPEVQFVNLQPFS